MVIGTPVWGGRRKEAVLEAKLARELMHAAGCPDVSVVRSLVEVRVSLDARQAVLL